jgi:hypothetical protein
MMLAVVQVCNPPAHHTTTFISSSEMILQHRTLRTVAHQPKDSRHTALARSSLEATTRSISDWSSLVRYQAFTSISIIWGIC